MPHPSLLPSNPHLIPGPPKHRHASPSGPWPFMDIDAEVDRTRLADQEAHFSEVAKECTHEQFLHLNPNDTALGDEEEELDDPTWSPASGDHWEKDRFTSMGAWGGAAVHDRMGSISSITSIGSASASTPVRRPTRRATVFQYKPAGWKSAPTSTPMSIPMVSHDPVSYTSTPSPTGEVSPSGSSPTFAGNTNANVKSNQGFANAIASGRPGSPTSITSIGSTGSLRIPSPTLSEYHTHHFPPGFNAFHKAQQAMINANTNAIQNQNQNQAQAQAQDHPNSNPTPPPRSSSIELLSDSSSTEFGLNIESPTPYQSMSPHRSDSTSPDALRSMSLDTMMSIEYEQTVPCWCKYPQSLYPNWTETQQRTSGILGVRGVEPRQEKDAAGVWILDVVKREVPVGMGRVGHVRTGSAGSDKGKEREVFRSSLGVSDSPTTPTRASSPFLSTSATPNPNVTTNPSHATPSDPDEFQEVTFIDKGQVMLVYQDSLDVSWEKFLTPRADDVKTRVFFVDKLTGPIMQMLGTHFQIEPFFFSSTIGKIPSRFQSNVVPGKSDHLTITLPFIRSVKCTEEEIQKYYTANGRDQHLVIDTEQPLPLSESNNLLLSDMLSLHIIRSPRTNTIISIHPPSSNPHTASASTLHSRVFATGRSVYWNHILKASRDPTFLFLSFLWYALYAWDESFEHLYSHICSLESRIMGATDMRLTQELHVVRAHLLHYESMLEDFRKAVVFVLSSPNQGLVGMGREEQEEVRRDLEEQVYVVNVGYQKGEEVGEGEGQEEVKPWLGDTAGDGNGGVIGTTTTTTTAVGVISEEPEEEEAEDVGPPDTGPQRQRRESPSTPTKLSGMRLRAQSASGPNRPGTLGTQRPPLTGVIAGGLGSTYRPRAGSHSQQPPPPSPSARHNLGQGSSASTTTAVSPPHSPNKYPSYSSSTHSGRPGSPTMSTATPSRSFTSSTTAPHRSHTRTSSLSSLAHPELIKQRNEIEARHRKVSRAMMRKECAKLLQEIERLEKGRNTQNKRLKNVMDLGFSIVNIEDSKRMHELTKAALRDSAAMKQISYLTMVFLPASFVAAAFGMNVIEINPGGSYAHLWQYVAFSVPLTIITVWVIIALQIEMRQPNFKRATSVAVKPKSRRKRLMEDAENVRGLPGSGGGGRREADPFRYPPHQHRTPSISININGAPPEAYDETDRESNTTSNDDDEGHSTTDEETEDEVIPEYGEFYASSLDHKPGLFSNLGTAFTRRGGTGKIPTSNDPAGPAMRMTDRPILGRAPAGVVGGGYVGGYGRGDGDGDTRGMIQLSLWRRLAWPVWMLATFIERRKLKWERARRRREREERRKRKKAEREANMRAMVESRAGSVAA